MLPLIILFSHSFLLVLPSIICKKYVFRRILPRGEAFGIGCLIALAIVAVPIISSIALFGISMFYDLVLPLVVIVLFIAAINALILCKGTARYNVKGFRTQLEKYKEFFDENAYNKELPKHSLKTLYKLASKENCDTIDYIQKYVPPKILEQCENLREQSEELSTFLQICYVKHVFSEAYINLLYNKYMKPAK